MSRWTITALIAMLASAMCIGWLLSKKIRNAMNNSNGTPSFAWPARGRVSTKFGPRVHPITGAKQTHNGIDIAMAIGTDLKAPADAVVLSVYTHATGGKSIILQHAGGWRTGYAHLSQQLVKVGDKLTAGQVFAKSGNTGASTGPHLHLTLTDPAGQKVDPEQYFA